MLPAFNALNADEFYKILTGTLVIGPLFPMYFYKQANRS